MKNGTCWLDQDGKRIQAHGGCILFHKGIFYWYGEDKGTKTRDGRVDFLGFSCYSSRNLLEWKNEGRILSAVSKPGHELGPDRVGERPSVLWNPKTERFVLWFHLDSADYSYARLGVADSDSPTGPFRYLGSVRPGGMRESRDMTVFADEGGLAYLISSSDGNSTLLISELDHSYTGFTGREKSILCGQYREAPAVIKEGGRYYLLTSGCTGWDPNPMLCAEADSIWGRWRLTDNPCRGEGRRKTFGGQAACTFSQGGKWYVLLDHWNPDDLSDSGYSILPVNAGADGIDISWQDNFGGIDRQWNKKNG